jgi:4-amino-4-deoxy-L-arabinose transferase-like glycosyltransferase
MCGSACLLLANLGNQYLWQDEAQTALVSKTILTEGVPYGYDGKNFFSQEEGAEYGDNYIWRWHTWLSFYVLAGFYKVFGVSTFVSRLPFALFGIGTVLLTYFFARQLWPGTRVPAIAAALLAISVPFLLLCRQCRYYSMTMFFSVLALYAYASLSHGKKYAAVTLFVASTLLFHSQHIYAGVLLATLLLHAIIFHWARLKILLVVTVITIIVNVPWLVWLAGIKVQHPPLQLHHWFMLVFYTKIYIKTYLASIAHYVFPPWLLAPAFVAAVTKPFRTRYSFKQGWSFLEKVSLPVFFVIFNIIAVATLAPLMFFRYLAPAIPLLIILIAVILDAVADLHLLLAVATAAILIATGQFKDYLYEITHDYDGPEEGIACYLNEHGSPNDIVAVTYGDMSLKFYTAMRVVGGLTGEDFEPAKNARWVIIRKEGPDKMAKYLNNNIDWNRYRKIEINYPDIPYENREDPGEHLFRTCTTADKVVIHERIK